MKSLSARWPSLLTLALLLAANGCNRDKTEQLAPPPPPPPASAPTETVLAPLEVAPIVQEDASADAALAAPKKGGASASSFQTRIRQCCFALRGQAKKLGAGPEATQLTQVAGMCEAFAAQAGGAAPELAPLKAMLQGVAAPAVCRAF